MVDEEFPEETEEDVYDGESREGLTEDAEITPEEEAFMQGYDEADEESDEESEEESDKDKDADGELEKELV